MSEYFNMDGILHFHTLEEFEEIVNSLTPEMYEEKKEASKRTTNLVRNIIVP